MNFYQYVTYLLIALGKAAYLKSPQNFHNFHENSLIHSESLQKGRKLNFVHTSTFTWTIPLVPNSLQEMFISPKTFASFGKLLFQRS